MFRILNSSNNVKNSSSESNSISLIVSISRVELIANSSKNWAAYSSFESLLYSAIYWFNRRSNSERYLYSRWRSEKRFFEFIRFFSELLIDQQSDFLHTKHFLKRRAWNRSFLSRKSSRRLNDFSRRYYLSMKYRFSNSLWFWFSKWVCCVRSFCCR
jgi:hypothetical protein